MLFLNVLVALLEFASLSQTFEITVNCTVNINDKRFFCVAENLTSTNDYEVITKVSGKDDVKAVAAARGSAVTGTNNISFLFLGIGKAFPNIEDLFISNAHLKFIKRENFANMGKLKLIYFLGNEIENVSVDTFEDLSGLEFLSLCGSKLKSLHEDLLSKLINLQQFRANINEIEVLPENFFAHNPNLSEIYLIHGKLVSIKVDFTKLTQIKEIYLTENTCINENFLSTSMAIADFQQRINSKCSKNV